jgi:hypothetical protein
LVLFVAMGAGPQFCFPGSVSSGADRETGSDATTAAAVELATDPAAFEKAASTTVAETPTRPASADASATTAEPATTVDGKTAPEQAVRTARASDNATTAASSKPMSRAASPPLVRLVGDLRPTSEDHTPESLRRYLIELTQLYGNYRDVPLDVKAAYFEWQINRYHFNQDDFVSTRVLLPTQPGETARTTPGADTSTWNGALLSALSYEYAVTRDKATLGRVARLLRGMHRLLEVTGMPGLIARCLAREGEALEPERMHPFTAGDGTRYHVWGDPAKGTYIQVLCGYARMMMHVYPDLPRDVRSMARADLSAMLMHVIDHDFRLTNRDGSETPYGNMTPLVGSVGVPFNAQAAYLVVALGYGYPPEDAAARERVFEAFRRLRGKHHVFYEDPWLYPVVPQRVGASPVVKGMNDRNHVINAAFVSLELERDHARQANEAFNQKFVYRMGRTMYWGMQRIEGHHNSLCNFMWAGILNEPGMFDVMIPRRSGATRQQVDRVMVNGIEQLRRFRLDRFDYPGRRVEVRQPQWVDRYRPENYYWKNDPFQIWEFSGPPKDSIYAAIDYLYAYWLLRYYHLERHPAAVGAHAAVLGPTPGIYAVRDLAE